MFDNIGSKCKTVAVVIMILGTLGAIVGGFELIDSGESTTLVGFVIVVVGILSWWMGALSFFALGEIAETVERIEQNTRQEKEGGNVFAVTKKPIANSAFSTPLQVDSLSEVGELVPEAEHMILCPSCHSKNKAGQKKCRSCDAPLG